MIVRRGFTLIELLVVIAIIGLLVGILLPALSSARQAAITLKCLTQIKNVGTAFSMYYNDSDDRVPYAYFVNLRDREYITYDDAISQYLGHYVTKADQKLNGIPANKANPILICPNDDTEDRPANLAKRSYSMVQGWQRTQDMAKGLQPPGTGITTSTSYSGRTDATPQFIVSSQDIPSPTDTLLLSEKVFNGLQSNYQNTQGRQTNSRSGVLRRAYEQVNFNTIAWDLVVPHGSNKHPLYNYLYVDGHARTAAPIDTIGADEMDKVITLGEWTRDKKD
ncbi:putative major pilin subunit [Poriferisphaera corsica]|uniref:Putative major pilin subunit n=1 Tax=Poriferisphaera corsica TaxID=2528020 RepID=A0A517YX27_9BACT|nr:type II secretion system protein [Poriferisphaera corsica]QDU34788.1 putative major pilin subunit [Poriferisphaera corsica]